MSLNLDYLSCEERLDAAIAQSETSLARLQAVLARGKGLDCGPSDENGATLCSDSVVPGPGVRIPVSGEAVATRRRPVQPKPALAAKGLLSSESVAVFQGSRKTGVLTPALGVASPSRVVGNGASCISSSADSTGRGVSPGRVSRNAGPWRQVGLFLDAQHLESLGLRVLP